MMVQGQLCILCRGLQVINNFFTVSDSLIFQQSTSL